MCVQNGGRAQKILDHTKRFLLLVKLHILLFLSSGIHTAMQSTVDSILQKKKKKRGIGMKFELMVQMPTVANSYAICQK